MQTIFGNILNISSGCIVHQVNTRQVAGAGLALQIRKRWPDWFRAYQRLTLPLGKVMYYQVNPDLMIASLYAQAGYGTGARQTNYAALGAALLQLNQDTHAGAAPQVYVPYRLGCGLAGGDWGIVQAILQDAVPHAIIVQLDPSGA